MQEKLIVTLWKAQIKNISKENTLYCRLTYNGQERNSKTTSNAQNLTWKETFLFPLAKQQLPLKLQFIILGEGQQIHFVKQQVADSLSFGKSLIPVDVNTTNRGSLPCKVDILDKKGEIIGKIFIEYEIIKTEVAYTVQKQLDYMYLMKLTNFKVNFVRNLKKIPNFFLKFNIEGKSYKEDLPMDEDTGNFYYNYPVKLYMKRELDMQIQLQMKDYEQKKFKRNQNHSVSSYTSSVISSKKTQMESIGKKQKKLLELGSERITAAMDLNFKKDGKYIKKLPLTVPFKFQKREIGFIEFQIETVFRSKQELMELQEQKKGLLNPERQLKLEKKKGMLHQGNGLITINSILGKLELFNDSVIENKNMSIEVKLGKQTQFSSVLQNPGKELIFIDTFIFHRTWEETIKITIDIHKRDSQKIPTYFADVNLRQLFQIGRYISKKVKLRDQAKNYSGELVLDMVYKQQEEKKASFRQPMISKHESSLEPIQEIKIKAKRQMIEQRLKKREEQKQRSRELHSLSTLAVLQDNEIILPPLNSRLQTLSPQSRFKSANIFNVNGSIKFTRSPRFDSAKKESYESFIAVRESDFDTKRKKGTFIGYGKKYDFTKPFENNPGVGRYEIQSVWDKYK